MKDHARSDLYTRDPLHDEFRSHNCFGFADILLPARTLDYRFGRLLNNRPKEELAVEIADVDRIHVYDMNVLEAG